MALAACSLSPQTIIIPNTAGSSAAADLGPYPLYLPIAVRTLPPAPNSGLFHVPYLNYEDPTAERMPEMSIFWFGRITPDENYSDVRMGYNDESLFVHVAVIDRLLWYDTSPADNDLTHYDAVTVYLDRANSTGSSPSPASYRIEAQFSPEYTTRQSYQAVYRWNGSGWGRIDSNIRSETGWRSNTGGLNDLSEDRGWFVSLEIPFSELGLSGKPADKNLWKMAVELHDRDAPGSTRPTKTWPAALDANRPASWKTISFGLPADVPPTGTRAGSASIRQGVDGQLVSDGSVGGNPNCGEGLDFWTEWGNTTYNGFQSSTEANIQNQRDIADWPCFSKYYITFPLDRVPVGRTILSANLTLYQFGGGGSWGVPSPPYRSLIQVFTVAEDINPATLTWNNAPLPVENVSRGWVDVYDDPEHWPGQARTFDLTRAVAEARRFNQPLRLVLYSADGAYHSGKYFHTSDVEDWAVNARPILEVQWAER